MLIPLPPTRCPTASEEATAAMSATRAATRDKEQKIRRHGDPLNVRWTFLIIELRVRFSWLRGMDTGATVLIKGPAPCQDFPDGFVLSSPPKALDRFREALKRRVPFWRPTICAFGDCLWHRSELSAASL